MHGQQEFIDTLRTALGRNNGAAPANDLFTTRPSSEQAALLEKIQTRTATEKKKLVEVLKKVAGPLYIDLHLHASLEDTARGIADLILQKDPEWGTEKNIVCWEHPLLNQLELQSLPALQDIAIHTTPLSDATDTARPLSSAQKLAVRTQVEKSFIGITSADYCVAATATLALKSRPGQARSVSLVPSIHVVVIEERQMLATLEELYTLLKWDPTEQAEGLTNCLSLISGPSKTGDIELIMVHGAHGPRELHLFVVGGND